MFNVGKDKKNNNTYKDYSIHVEGLGTFYYTCVSNGKGVDTEKEVNANQITGTRVRFVPESTRKGNTITRALIGKNVTWRNIETFSKLDGTGTSTTPGGGEEEGGGTEPGEGQEEDPLA